MEAVRNGPVDHNPWQHEIVYELDPAPIQHPRESRRKFLGNLIRTSIVFFAHACMGLMLGLGGPAFLDLLIITNVNVQEGSIYFTMQYLGILVSGTAAGLLYDRYHAEPILMAAVMGSGVLNVIVPYCSMIGLMAFVNFAKGMTMGLVFIGVGAVVQRIWGKRSGPYQQALHFAFSVGGVIAPAVMRPFLARLDEITELTHNSTTLLGNSSADSHLDELGTEVTVEKYGPTRVQSGFLIIGVVTVFSGCTIVGLVITDRRTLADRFYSTKTPEEMNSQALRTDKPLTRRVRAIFLAAICAYYILIVASETLFQNFLMTYVVSHLKWDKGTGTSLMSMYWSAFAFGRLSGVPAAKYITPGKIIAIDFVAMTVAVLVFMFGSENYGEIVWAASGVFAVFVASLFAAGITYVDHYIMRVTGKVYSVIIMAATTGGMINPPILGALIQNYSEKWFVYLALILCILNLFTVAALGFLTRKWGRVGPNAKIPQKSICCRRRN